MKRKYEIQISIHESRRKGSALILTVVLMTLLAVVGVVFLLVSRIDKVAASAAAKNRELNFAIDTVVTKISQELTLDVPGIAGQEYYDYPGPADRWLASLEPNDNQTWLQISDIYNKLGSNLQLPVAKVQDYQDAASMGEGKIADADGDGIADSRWVIIPDVNSGKGKPIYAAVRVIDNAGMLNVNTAYKFDPNTSDGSSQLQINLMALANRPRKSPTATDELNLLAERANHDFGNNLPGYKADLTWYEQAVIWYYNGPYSPYTPFDISDELELRNRFLLNQQRAGAHRCTRRTIWLDRFLQRY